MNDRQQRVQVRELGPAGPVRPQARPVDTYVTPPRQSGVGENQARLASALAGFSSSIGGMIGLAAQRDQEASEKEKWAIEKRLAGLTREEAAQAVRSGQIEQYEDPFAQQTVQAAYGVKFGGQRAAEVRQFLTTEFDWDEGNVEEYIAGVVTEDIEQYGADPNFGRAYAREMERLRAWSLQYAEKRRSDSFSAAQVQGAYGVLDTRVDQLLEAGAGPDDVVGAVRSMYPELGDEGTLGLTYEDVDRQVLAKASRIAESNPEVALALLSSERPSRDGQRVTLDSQVAYRDRADQIKARATRSIRVRTVNEGLAQVADADVGLLREGNLQDVADLSYTDADGNPRTLTRQQRVDAAVKRYLTEGRTDPNEPPGERLGREVRTLRTAGVKHPDIARRLTGLSELASLDLLSPDNAEGRQEMEEKLQTYSFLRETDKNATFSYTTEEDREFAETYFMGIEQEGMSKDEALEFALQTAAPADVEGLPSLGRAREQVEAAVDELATEPGFLWGTNTSRPVNAAVAEQRVSKLATRYVRSGMDVEKAVERAGKLVRESSITYNGAIINAQGLDIPQGFNQGVDRWISAWSQQNAPLGLERGEIELENITLKPAGGDGASGRSGGRFKLVEKDAYGSPVRDDQGRQVFVTLDQIRKTSQAVQAEQQTSQLRDLQARREGLTHVPDQNGYKVYIRPGTREIMEYTPQGIFKPTGRRLPNLGAPGLTPGQPSASEREVERVREQNIGLMDWLRSFND